MMTLPVLSEQEIKKLLLPAAPHPRPGESVVWHQNGRRYEGQLIGHRYDGRPTVLHRDGAYSDDLNSFDQLRALDPFAQQLPNWRNLPSAGVIIKPGPTEVNTLDSLLQSTFPSGRSYFEVAEEIWKRGYEIFLVGGTVRDVLAGLKPNDIDFITTMPLKTLINVVEAVCRFSRKQATESALKHGHIRLGGTPGSTDPFADISVFKFNSTGTTNTIFGADFQRDMIHRDFTCNAIYYDPLNKTLIDPSGTGVIDTKNLLLRPVFEINTRPKHEFAKIVIRTFKFTSRGYKVETEYREHIVENCAVILQSLNQYDRLNYIRTQLLSKHPREKHDAIIAAYKAEFVQFGLTDVWDALVDPILLQIKGARK
jgi:hypothetical protein